jgi:hypothetical protein
MYNVGKRLGNDGKKLYKKLEKQYQEDFEAKQMAIQSWKSVNEENGASAAPNTSTDSDVENSNAATGTGTSWGSNRPPFLPTLGPMNDSQSRKVLFYLISSLNMAFPDYDFSSVKAEHFARHRIVKCAQSINNWFQIMSTSISSSSPSSHSDMNLLSKKFWAALDQVIILY